MKLVDILARELKVWPEGYGDIGQAESGKLHVVTGWNYRIGWTSESYTQAEDWASAVITRTEWQAAVDALNAPKVVEWDGKGMPPVGVDCEYRVGGGTWFECNIRYVTKPYIDCPVEVVMFARHLKGEQTGVAGEGEGEVSFRPIRTPEQITADAREKAVREVYDSCSGQGRSVLEMLGEAYDAGRKQVAK